MKNGSLAFKVLGMIVGLAFVMLGYSQYTTAQKLKEHGKVAIVDPISGYTEHTRNGSVSYSAEFRFKTDQGVEIVATHNFPKELISDFEENNPVKVIYDPDSPSQFAFEQQEPSAFLIIAGAVITIMAFLFA